MDSAKLQQAIDDWLRLECVSLSLSSPLSSSTPTPADLASPVCSPCPAARCVDLAQAFASA